MSDTAAQNLINVTRSLSKDAEEQLQELAALGCPEVIDELALQFSDHAMLAEQLCETGQISSEQQSIVTEISSLLIAMSGQANAHLWTPAALRVAPEWTKVRRLARAFLHATQGAG